MPTLVLERLGKVYANGVRALSAFDLSLSGNQMAAVVGPSGCGKTTLLRLVAGLESPGEGRVLLDGRDLAGVPPHARGVGMVFQDHPLYPSRDVRANLAYPLRLAGASADSIDAEVRRCAERLGLTEALAALPGELSGGQRQRVALGRALVRRPAVSLFDEPLSSLDAGLRRQLRRLIKQLQREAAGPALYVTHDQEEALALADVLVVLDRGRARQVGTPREVYELPADRFVAGFVGGMNFIEGRSEGGRFVHAGGVVTGVEPPAGREVTLGFRPEALTPADVPGRTLSGRVRSVEYLGGRCEVTLDVAGAAVVGRFARTAWREGDEVTASLAGPLLWFDPGADGPRRGVSLAAGRGRDGSGEA